MSFGLRHRQGLDKVFDLFSLPDEVRDELLLIHYTRHAIKDTIKAKRNTALSNTSGGSCLSGLRWRVIGISSLTCLKEVRVCRYTILLDMIVRSCISFQCTEHAGLGRGKLACSTPCCICEMRSICVSCSSIAQVTCTRFQRLLRHRE